MTDTRLTIERVISANQIPSLDTLPASALTSAGLLARIDERSMAMTNTTLTPVHDTGPGNRPNRWRGPLIALAAAAALILLIGVTTFNVLRGDENPVTTEPPPTTIAPATTVAPATTAAPTTVARTPLEILNGYIDSRNRHDADEMASFFADSATISGDLASSPSGYAPAMDLERVTGWHFTLGTCREAPGGVEQQITLQCPFTWENDWSKALELGPIASARTAFTFTIVDGQIERLDMVLDIGEFYTPVPGTNLSDVMDPFVEWLDRTHPDDKWTLYDENQCFDGGACAPRLTPEAIDLWERYSAEFVEFVGSQPGE